MSRYLSTLCFVTCFVFSIFPHLAVADFTSLTIKLNSSAGGDQINPSIASLPDDKFVVIWSDRAGMMVTEAVFLVEYIRQALSRCHLNFWSIH